MDAKLPYRKPPGKANKPNSRSNRFGGDFNSRPPVVVGATLPQRSNGKNTDYGSAQRGNFFRTHNEIEPAGSKGCMQAIKIDGSLDDI